jgi:hypothetical protein
VPQELYQELLERLDRVRSRRERLDLFEGLANSATALVVIALAAVALEAAFHLSIGGRTALFWSSVILFLAAASAFLYLPLATRFGFKPRLTDEAIAARIGAHYPTVSDSLLNGLQLARPIFARTSLIGSPAFALAAFNRTYEEARPLDFQVIVEERPLKRALLFFFVALVGSLGIFFGLHSEMSSAATRLIHFRTFYQKPAPFVLHVTPGNSRVMRSDSLHIRIATTGEQLRQLTIHLREEGQKEFDTISIASIETRDSVHPNVLLRTFQYDIRIQHPIEYYAESRGIESDKYHVSVLDHPIVRKLLVTVTPPAYTRERPIVLNENFGDVTGIAGTHATFQVIASKKLKGAWIIFEGTKPVDSAGRSLGESKLENYPLQIEDSIARGSLAFMRSGTYHIALLDNDSIASEHPIEYTVTIAKDEPPTIALIEPNDRADLPSNLRLNMLARVHDDFGFRSVRLGARLTKSKFLPPEKEYKWLDIPLADHNVQDLDVPYIWNLTKLELAPEDEVGYVLEVADNDAVTGPKLARTVEYTVRYPSVKEIFERANEQETAAEKNLSEIKQDATELKKKIDEAVNEMRQTKSANIAKEQQEFSKKKDAEQLLQRQEDLNKRLDDVSKNLEQMTDQLKQQQALSPETMQKYEDLQKLFQQINSPEMKKAMEQLQQAMKTVDPKQMQEAMKNMQFNEEQFKKSLERTTNILKKIQMEQKVDELAKREGELAKQEDKASDTQKDAAKSPEKQNAQDKAQSKRQQEDAKKELDRLNKEAADLAKQMQKLPENMQAPEEMKKAQEALADPAMEKSMDDASDASQQNDPERSSERSKDAASKMKDAQRKMRDLKQKLSENQKQRDTREMKQIRDELNRLSKSQEALKNQTQQAQQNSNVFRDLADQQSQKKDQLGQTASKTMELAQRSTAVPPAMGKDMGEAMNQMQKAQDAMTERDQSNAQQSGQSAMASLNKAAQEAQQALDKMSKQGSGKGKPGQGKPGGQQGQGEGENPDGENPGQGEGSAMQQFLNSINKLTQQQKQLNDMMSGMPGQPGGSAQQQMMQQQGQLAKLAAQQQAVQKSLQDLSNEQKSAQNGDKRASDNLKKISDEMQDVISDMKTSGVRPETVQRQERILSKLLEAQQSVHERDKDQQRESKPGESTTTASPRDLDLKTPEARKQLQDELNKAKESGYSKDYDALIQKYFEALQKAGVKPQ